MQANRKFITLLAMFLIQATLLIGQDRLFQESMDFKSELAQSGAVKAGMPERQAQAVASAVREVKYEVSSYVRNAIGASLIINFCMLTVAAGDGRKDAD